MRLANTQHEKYEIAREVLGNKNLIKGLFKIFDHFEDIESTVGKINSVFAELKQAEEERIREEEAMLAQAKEVKSILDGMGISLEEFNRLMVRSGNIGAVTLSEATSEANVEEGTTAPVKANKATSKRAKQPRYVFQYEEDGIMHRTPLRAPTGVKPAGMKTYMQSQGYNSAVPEDCLHFAVAPTQEEINAYIKKGGDVDLIANELPAAVKLASQIEGGEESQELPEDVDLNVDPSYEDEPEVDVDSEEESYGNR